MIVQLTSDTSDGQKARAKAIQAEAGPILSLAKEQFEQGMKALKNGYPSSAQSFLSIARDTLDNALKQFPKE